VCGSPSPLPAIFPQAGIKYQKLITNRGNGRDRHGESQSTALILYPIPTPPNLRLVLEGLLLPFGITSLAKLFPISDIYILSFVHDFSAQGR